MTWVQPGGSVDLRKKGIDESQAADLRSRLGAFAEGWDRPEMAIYDELPPRRFRLGIIPGFKLPHIEAAAGAGCSTRLGWRAAMQGLRQYALDQRWNATALVIDVDPLSLM